MAFQKAKVARYYGWTDAVIRRMPIKRFKEYLKAIEPLKAEEKLSDLDLASYAYWKKEHQKKLRRELHTVLRRRVNRSDGRPISFEELVAGKQNG